MENAEEVANRVGLKTALSTCRCGSGICGRGEGQSTLVLFFTTEAVEGAATAAAVAFLRLFLGLAPSANHPAEHSAPQGQDQEKYYVRC